MDDDWSADVHRAHRGQSWIGYGGVMRAVIKRHFTKDLWNHRDVPSSYEVAEKIYGAKLDRRKNYALIKNEDTKKWEVCEEIHYTSACSGCSDDSRYGSDDIGGGCHECGYSGKVRHGYWHPLSKPLDKTQLSLK